MVCPEDRFNCILHIIIIIVNVLRGGGGEYYGFVVVLLQTFICSLCVICNDEITLKNSPTDVCIYTGLPVLATLWILYL